MRTTVDISEGSYNSFHAVVEELNATRPPGAPVLKYGPLMRSLLGSWVRAHQNGANGGS